MRVGGLRTEGRETGADCLYPQMGVPCGGGGERKGCRAVYRGRVTPKYPGPLRFAAPAGLPLMNDGILYLVVFLASLAVDLIPVIGPPAWTAMVFLLVKYDLNPWIVLAVGVPGSTLGRYLLSLYIPKVSERLIKRHKNEELQFVGRKLNQKLWRSWVFVFTYSLLPLSTTALFTAAGIARVQPLQIIPPFFVGKFICDAVMLYAGRYATMNADELVHGAFSAKSLITAGVGLLILGLLLFLDWRVLLQRRKIAFNFRIWR
jgi:membrane protein DedA with SNARE-associated domain